MIIIESLDDRHRPWAHRLLDERWGSADIVSRGVWTDARACPSLVALKDGEPVGLLTYQVKNGELEVLTLDSTAENVGVGGALLNASINAARQAGCARLWLATTNDNLRALGFYQKRGMRITGVRPNALVEARRQKPSIPEVGFGGIPISDEIELPLELGK
ncbi:MAG TPA: GNAT family N-acetyltransferase [Fimbriimonadaceae bacterium]|nr:GNAT family N-acetyltransferase [Fimbriimonadaceae bacterium]